VAGDLLRGTLSSWSLTGGSHAQKISCRKAPAGTGLPALLLGSKKRRRFLGRAGVSPFSMLAPKMLSGAPVEML
jgi:hypothetical protein